MAKNSLPMMRTGGGVASKIVGVLITAVIVVIALNHPVGAGQFVTTVLTAIGQVFHQVAH